MRVLRVSDLQFKEFPDLPDDSYAILSHVWDTAELSLQDMRNHSHRDPFYLEGKEMACFKLEGCRSQARRDGIRYIWIDTCCIDKPNHSEFNEAINSMYYWYKMAKVCYAYLADVSSTQYLRGSKWFTRGWTLQELIAPSDVQFFDYQWNRLGDKYSLASTLSEVTKIPAQYLFGADLEDASIAERMSWASRRTTTKEEDLAYCLLGIFDVHMPLLYGERLISAFRRLQLQILEMQDDTSIFAWYTPDFNSRPNRSEIDTFGLLAPSPASFKECHDIVRAELPVANGYREGIRTPILFNNKGLHLSLPVFDYKDGELLAVLGCTKRGRANSRYAVLLKDISTNGGRYVRIKDLYKREIDDVFKRSARFENITTEVRLFKKLSAVPASDWNQLRSEETPWKNPVLGT